MQKYPFQINTKILSLTAEISELVGAMKFTSEAMRSPQLRRSNRIKTIYSSLAIEQNTLSLEQVTRRDLDYVLNAENLSNQEEEMIFPIFNYKGYQAELSDGTQLPIEIGPYHKIKLIIPANTRWEGLHVYFKEPAVWRVAECVSLITAILLSAYLIISLRRKKREHAV